MRTLSWHQYGTLKFIAENTPTLAYLRIAHAATLTSLLHPGRNYLYVTGRGDEAVVVLTKTGDDALRTYTNATLNERHQERELTERCLRLLKHARRLSAFSKSNRQTQKGT